MAAPLTECHDLVAQMVTTNPAQSFPVRRGVFQAPSIFRPRKMRAPYGDYQDGVSVFVKRNSGAPQLHIRSSSAKTLHCNETGVCRIATLGINRSCDRAQGDPSAEHPPSDYAGRRRDTDEILPNGARWPSHQRPTTDGAPRWRALETAQGFSARASPTIQSSRDRPLGKPFGWSAFNAASINRRAASALGGRSGCSRLHASILSASSVGRRNSNRVGFRSMLGTVAALRRLRKCR